MMQNTTNQYMTYFFCRIIKLGHLDTRSLNALMFARFSVETYEPKLMQEPTKLDWRERGFRENN